MLSVHGQIPESYPKEPFFIRVCLCWCWGHSGIEHPCDFPASPGAGNCKTRLGIESILNWFPIAWPVRCFKCPSSRNYECKCTRWTTVKIFIKLGHATDVPHVIRCRSTALDWTTRRQKVSACEGCWSMAEAQHHQARSAAGIGTFPLWERAAHDQDPGHQVVCSPPSVPTSSCNCLLDCMARHKCNMYVKLACIISIGQAFSQLQSQVWCIWGQYAIARIDTRNVVDPEEIDCNIYHWKESARA